MASKNKNRPSHLSDMHKPNRGHGGELIDMAPLDIVPDSIDMDRLERAAKKDYSKLKTMDDMMVYEDVRKSK